MHNLTKSLTFKTLAQNRALMAQSSLALDVTPKTLGLVLLEKYPLPA